MLPVNKELLDKYIQGQCTPEEEGQVLQWLDNNDIEDYQDVHTDKKYNRKESAGWQQLVKHFDELQPATGRKNFFGKWMWTAAAAIAVLIVISVYFGQSRLFHYSTKYQTTYGEIKRINLADGTTVTLNAQSVLKVRKDFNGKNRSVYLSGEAYFKVTHKADKPFTVNTDKLSVTALGTSFDVSAFSDDPEIKVSLKEGKVLVKTTARKKRQKVTLMPGESAIYKRNSMLLQTKKFNPKIQLAWQQQIISFENAGMQEVVRKIERFYGVTIDTHLMKPRQWHLTGEYKNQTLQGVLESLSFNYKIQYKIEEDKVVLY